MRTVEPITGEVVLADHDSVQQALFDRHLSRTFDKRTYDEGNIREGVVSTLHGTRHRSRRRIENTQFRVRDLHTYEHVLFPPIIDRFVTDAADDGGADLFRLGSLLAVVLAAQRAGFDYVMDGSRASASLPWPLHLTRSTGVPGPYQVSVTLLWTISSTPRATAPPRRYAYSASMTTRSSERTTVSSDS